MGFIAWIVVGAMAGILANRLTGTGGGLLMIVFGMIGGLAGGYLATNVLDIGSVSGIDVLSLAIAAAGGIAIALIGNLARNPRNLRARPV